MGYSSTTDFQGSARLIPERGISENACGIAVHHDGGATTEKSDCGANGCHHREVLRDALAEAIDTLEATRRAFKSKQLEVLRKKLMKVLVEEC